MFFHIAPTGNALFRKTYFPIGIFPENGTDVLKQGKGVFIINDIQVFIRRNGLVAMRQTVERFLVDIQRVAVCRRSVQNPLFRRFHIAFDLMKLYGIAKNAGSLDGVFPAFARPEAAVENNAGSDGDDAFPQ